MTLRASLQTAWASIAGDATEIGRCKGVSNHNIVRVCVQSYLNIERTTLLLLLCYRNV